ncbi:hypothetical protein M422DRAFT_253023 [Sphaerobolus stellatus SS14]|uniref:Uncharacterized protein n=1 Tax=Sphaerobolus stellatus (strain SS14) TaxID=990650 RepID=A0A0C9VZ06_SPHS4|nr:hypothetical protein M422DRAFT_253023 [Sphaerobolus stellatus SS14]
MCDDLTQGLPMSTVLYTTSELSVRVQPAPNALSRSTSTTQEEDTVAPVSKLITTGTEVGIAAATSSVKPSVRFEGELSNISTANHGVNSPTTINPISQTLQGVAAAGPTKIKGRKVAGKPNEWIKPSDLLPFRPYTLTNRDDQWAVSDEGKIWISQRIPSYRQMQPPGGLPIDTTTERQMTHRQWWTHELDTDFKKNWPDFDVTEVLGSTYSPAQLKKHEERVYKFIDNALRRQYAASSQSPADIFTLLIQRDRKPVAYNLWASETPEGDDAAKKMAQKEPGWAIVTDHLKIQMEMRKKLFEQLSEEEQTEWQKKANNSKNVPISEEDCIAAIPKIFGMVCDSIRKYTPFNCIILCGGKQVDGQTWEEWHRPSIIDPLGFTSTSNWKTIVGGFLHGLSKDTGVLANEIVQLPTWQRPNEYIPKVVVRLSEILEFDVSGGMLTSEAGAREATEKYLDALWALVPDKNGAPHSKSVPWTLIRQKRNNLAEFVDPSRLPQGIFIFERPKEATIEDLLLFIKHIIKGENGEIPPENIFKWTNQTDGNFQLAPRPRKQKRIYVAKGKGKGHPEVKSFDEEHINIDDVSTSEETEAEEAEPSRGSTSTKKQAKGQASSKPKAKPSSSKAKSKARKSKSDGDAIKLEQKAKLRQPSYQSQKAHIAEPSTSRSKSKGRAVSLGNQTKRTKSSNPQNQIPSSSDTDSDADDVAETRVCYKGDATLLFVGQHHLWKADFEAREAMIEWEKDATLDFGAASMESAKFVESAECFEDMQFHRILDLGHPITSLDEAVQDIIFDTGSPLPDASDFSKVDCSLTVEVLLNRMRNAIKMIMNHSPSGWHRWVRLGSASGVMLLLRLVEFVRRLAKHHEMVEIGDRIQRIRLTLNGLLAKEAWRRWARASFQISKPKSMNNEDHPGDIFILWDIWMSIQMGERVDEKAWLDLKWRRFLAEGSILARLSKESCITVRGDQEGNTVIDIREEEWSLPSSVSSVKDWANGMDDQSFVRGSVIEKFQYIFALAMAKWWGKLHADETWCSSAIIGVEDSLANLIRSADPDRLRKSKRLLKSQRFLPRPKPKPVEAKMAIEVIKTTNGYTSDNAMDVDMPPQTLVITPSPTKHGNVESRQTQVNPTEDDQTISSLNSFEQPVILDSQSSDGELEEAIVVDSPRKKRPSSEESVDTPPIKKQKSDDAPALAEEIVGNNPNSNSPLIVEPQGPKKRGRKAKQNVGGDSLSTGKRAPEVRPLRSMTTRARTKQPAKALERPVEGSVQPSETLMQSAETS